MTKQLRNILISVGVVVVLAGAMLFVTNSSMFQKKIAPSSSSSSGISVYNFEANSINKITVTNKIKNFTITKTSANFWVVDQLNKAPVVKEYISGAVTYLSTLSAETLVERNPTDLKKYGLDSPIATIIINTNSKDYTLLVGSINPLGINYYLYDKDNKTVYNVTALISTYFSNGPFYYVDKSLITYTADSTLPDIQSFYFGGSLRPLPITISRSKTTSTNSTPNVISDFEITKPVKLSANSDVIGSLNTTLSTLTADDCVSYAVNEEILKKYGLDNPKYTFEVTIKDKTVKLLFGNNVTENGFDYIYLMLSGRNIIYKISAASVAFCKYEIKDVAAPQQFASYIYNVKSITIENRSNIWKFDLSGSDPNLVVKYGNKALKTDYFQNFYMNIINLQFENQATEPQNAKSLYKITIEYKDTTQSPDVEEFFSFSTTECFWKTNGQGNLTILKKSLDAIIDDTKKIANGQDVTFH
jgi:hypothetical protein